MYKKLFGSILFIFSLMFFVSCQENEKKDTDQKDKRSYQRDDRKYEKDKKSDSAAMPTKKCPKDRPCPPPEKTCPNGCRKKCCINEKNENEISSHKEDALLQEKQEMIDAQDLSSNDQPLENLKAAIENQNILDLDE